MGQSKNFPTKILDGSECKLRTERLQAALKDAQDEERRLSGLIVLVSTLRKTSAPLFVSFVASNRESLFDLCSQITSTIGKDNDKDNDEDKDKKKMTVTLLTDLVGLVAIQAKESVKDLILEPLNQLRQILMDDEQSANLRTRCAIILAVASRFVCSDPEVIALNADACKSAWSTTVSSNDLAQLVATSLSAWCTILLDADTETLEKATEDQKRIVELLKAKHIEVRLAAVRNLGFLYELMRYKKPGFRFENTDVVLEVLAGWEQDLSISTKDRRVQSVIATDIRPSIVEDSDAPTTSLQTESKDLNCSLLRGGIAQHLANNELIPKIFGLIPIPTIQFGCKLVSIKDVPKNVYIGYFNDYVKHRSVQRGRERDEKMTKIYGDKEKEREEMLAATNPPM
ncbi:unnamed protein product [Caenorhabditis brenneri]